MGLITGAHNILYSSDPEADRAFLQNVLELPHVDFRGNLNVAHDDHWLRFHHR